MASPLKDALRKPRRLLKQSLPLCPKVLALTAIKPRKALA
jgi:hypothetical protein